MADKIPATGKWEGGSQAEQEIMSHASEIQPKTTKEAKGKHLAEGRALAKASRERTPGHAAGSDQDRYQRVLAGKEAAKELIRATKKKNKK
jgi:hypothetical protein